ncbi:hypothetical protein J4208_03180 [Candidatus Woesearchaeota archaeon]|nr:hypothetical protein [Candidatus Woesearchaeota archaeon]
MTERSTPNKVLQNKLDQAERSVTLTAKALEGAQYPLAFRCSVEAVSILEGVHPQLPQTDQRYQEVHAKLQPSVYRSYVTAALAYAKDCIKKGADLGIVQRLLHTVPLYLPKAAVKHPEKHLATTAKLQQQLAAKLFKQQKKQSENKPLEARL